MKNHHFIICYLKILLAKFLLKSLSNVNKEPS